MADARYHVPAGAAKCAAPIHDLSHGRPVVCLDGQLIPDCMFTQAVWLDEEVVTGGALVKHKSDELMMFIGSDVNVPEDLGMEVVYQLENDILVIDHTSFLFIPAGAAHGLLEIRKVRRPALANTCFYDESDYEDVPAEATAPKGSYAGYVVEKYAPVRPRVTRPAPEGFLTKILWIDGEKLAGAPYMEAVWFKCPNPSGPPNHTHEFGEVIGFLGTDPENPEELGAEIQITVDGRVITSERSFLVYIPAGVTHAPIIVPKLQRGLIHFSGGGKGAYVRTEK